MEKYFLFFSAEVLVTLTSDVGRILARLHQLQPSGNINFLTAVRVAHVRFLQKIKPCPVYYTLYYVYFCVIKTT